MLLKFAMNCELMSEAASIFRDVITLIIIIIIIIIKITVKDRLNGSNHAEACLRAYADSKGPDQPAHSRSLIRAFTFRQKNRRKLQNLFWRV